ncbi:hypothetical protein ACIOTI_25330 [Streptomyces sp. NPDC087843]|uniref:hypothetical protein n=1 Tax=Streptomyces sp. NPDC087843 TaxID=3365804 RepID=UPI003820A172
MLGQTLGRVPALDESRPKIISAKLHRLPVLHVDDDFAAIAKVRPGIPMIRLQPRTDDGPYPRRQTADA